MYIKQSFFRLCPFQDTLSCAYMKLNLHSTLPAFWHYSKVSSLSRATNKSFIDFSRANNCNPRPPPRTRKPKPCSETDKNVNGKKPLETTTPQLTQSTVWQDMSRPLYSGCEQDTVACEHIWSESASWTLHSAIAKKQNRRSTTSSRTVPSGGNRDTSYGRRVSQPLTSCGERRKTCAAPPSSWQHVDWGSKYGWSTAEEEEVEPSRDHSLEDFHPVWSASQNGFCQFWWNLTTVGFRSRPTYPLRSTYNPTHRSRPTYKDHTDLDSHTDPYRNIHTVLGGVLAKLFSTVKII